MLENDKYMKNAKTKQLKEAISRNLKLSSVILEKEDCLSYGLSEENKAGCRIYIDCKQGAWPLKLLITDQIWLEKKAESF